MINYEVLFFPNKDDNTHCFQACFKMVLKYFEPQKDFTWEELDEISAKKKDKWTWTMAGILWLKGNDYDVKNVEPFDYAEFSRDAKSYLVKTFGQEVADIQEKHSDLGSEQSRAEEFIHRIDTDKQIPEVGDITKLLDNGYLIIVCLNSNVLNKIEGYNGHFILIKGFTDKYFIVHNPGGYPGKPNQKIYFKLFEKAWAYPNEIAKNIIAIKK